MPHAACSKQHKVMQNVNLGNINGNSLEEDNVRKVRKVPLLLGIDQPVANAI